MVDQVTPAHKRRTGAVDISSVGKATFVVADRFPWWSVGAKMTSAGAPVAVGVIHPALGEATALIVIFVAVTVIATALFGSCELSKRAFRLMRWIQKLARAALSRWPAKTMTAEARATQRGRVNGFQYRKVPSAGQLDVVNDTKSLTATTKGPSAQVHRIAGEDPLSGAAMKVELVSFERNAKPQVAGSHCGFLHNTRYEKPQWAVLDLNQ